MDNKNKSQTGNKNNNSCNNNQGKDKGLGLASFSYADFILLSSTISYALAEELSETDLALFIVFLGMVTSDLALLTTQKQVGKTLSENIEEDVVGEEEAEEGGIIGSTIVIPTVGRNSKMKKRKRIKRIKKVKKK